MENPLAPDSSWSANTAPGSSFGFTFGSGISSNWATRSEETRWRLAGLRAAGDAGEALVSALVKLAEALVDDEPTSGASKSVATEAIGRATALRLEDLRWRAEYALARMLDEESDYEAARPLFERLRREAVAARAGLREVHCTKMLAYIALATSGNATAKAGFEEALSLCRQLNNGWGMAVCLQKLANIALDRRDRAGAKPLLEEALPLHRSEKRTQSEADCLENLGDVALHDSEHAEAAARYGQALVVHLRLDDLVGQGNCTKGLGDVVLACSRLDEATAHFERALALFRQAKSPDGEAHATKGLARVAELRAKYNEAAALYEAARELYRSRDNHLGAANCTSDLGDVARKRSDPSAAKSYYEKALALYRRDGRRLGEANSLDHLGDLAQDRAEAISFYQAALPIFQEIGDVLGQANCFRSMGAVAQELRDLDGAMQCTEKALSLYRRTGRRLGEANALMQLGDIAWRRFDIATVVESYEQAARLLEGASEPHALGCVHWRMARLAKATFSDATPHVAAARAAWASIPRWDLVDDLEKEFGPLPRAEGQDSERVRCDGRLCRLAKALAAILTEAMRENGSARRRPAGGASDLSRALVRTRAAHPTRSFEELGRGDGARTSRDRQERAHAAAAA